MALFFQLSFKTNLNEDVTWHDHLTIDLAPNILTFEEINFNFFKTFPTYLFSKSHCRSISLGV